MDQSYPEAAKDPAMLKRAAASSFLGSVIEYFDFFVYATCAAVVFKDVFFSNMSPLAGTLASLATFAAGYLARPFGGVIFGHYGDRLGRKRMLVLTMSIMGIASALIGVLPTYATAGAIAPILLVLLRVVQGIALGGEWGGAVLMSAEHADSRRGFWASFTNAGAPTGTLISTVVITSTIAILGNDAFVEWGWRLPFLFSLLLLVLGLVVRAKVDESPEFIAATDRAPDTGIPLLRLLKAQPKVLFLSVGVGLGAFVFQGALTTYSIAYGVQSGVPRQEILNALTISSFLSIFGIIGWSALSDKIGRRPMVIAGSVGIIAWGFALFPLIGSKSFPLIVLAMVVGQAIVHPMVYGPLAGLYTELFSTEYRYTGASLGYQLAGIGAGVSPVLFAEIMRSNGGTSTLGLSAVIALTALVSIACIIKLGETKNRRLSRVASDGADTQSVAADVSAAGVA
ncbi:MFS transporter [Rhodococcus sp. TAF43]|uniref:MFS transporter n=1 Tax=unclassified Rhodococcus (in: high G+C Gram-positive bacteria) TaxID=192944 RepID=UPI001581683E|nr:MFS transporter [Rhodococcus sp. W8901]QKT10281.1 MHS family MFS transporter [Rhodococcus sp. W8901]